MVWLGLYTAQLSDRGLFASAGTVIDASALRRARVLQRKTAAPAYLILTDYFLYLNRLASVIHPLPRGALRCLVPLLAFWLHNLLTRMTSLHPPIPERQPVKHSLTGC